MAKVEIIEKFIGVLNCSLIIGYDRGGCGIDVLLPQKRYHEENLVVLEEKK